MDWEDAPCTCVYGGTWAGFAGSCSYRDATRLNDGGANGSGSRLQENTACAYIVHAAQHNIQIKVRQGATSCNWTLHQRSTRGRADLGLVHKDTIWTPPGPGPRTWTRQRDARRKGRAPCPCRRKYLQAKNLQAVQVRGCDGWCSSGRLWTGRWATRIPMLFSDSIHCWTGHAIILSHSMPASASASAAAFTPASAAIRQNTSAPSASTLLLISSERLPISRVGVETEFLDGLGVWAHLRLGHRRSA